MICNTCRVAGDYNQKANRLTDADAGERETLYRIAENTHSYCADINCPCAHQTGGALTTAARKLQDLLLRNGAELDGEPGRRLYGDEPRNVFRKDGFG